MKICVVTPIYNIAGVPLAQHRFARALADAGHAVDFVIGRIEAGYVIPPTPGVNVIVLDRPNVRGLLLPLMRYLKTAQPEMVFSAEDHLNAITLLAAILSNSSAKISGSSRVTPFDTYSNTPFSKRWFLKQVVRAVIWRADALTCVSEDMVKQYQQVFRHAPHLCIYNIVADANSRLRMQEPLDHPWFTHKECPVLVAAGRLAPWKGFADLIHAMKLLQGRSKARLVILGDGPLRIELQDSITRLGLNDSVMLQGYVDNPLKFYRHADAFVLSSLVEGLPNVLVEAMLCGCTPVATDCPTGPREVLGGGKYGYLVPVRNPEAMAEAILKALANPIPEGRLSEAVSPFSEARVLARHFEVLGVDAPYAGARASQ
jgi:glycosyltransferase involved in cell wall biosynthesis